MINFAPWTEATANLSWGAQHAMHTSLSLASDGSIELVYGSDYVDGKPCLVNSVGQMLSVGGGQGIPSANFGAVVREFDSLNDMFLQHGVNETRNHVSPLAAEILVKNFGPLKTPPEGVDESNFDGHELISERSDGEFTASWLQAISTDAPTEPKVTNEVAEDSSIDR